MQLSQRKLWIMGAIALAAIIVITAIAAPSSSKLNSGSTYGRSPDGYGAWYAYMKERGTPIERWQRPFDEFMEHEELEASVTLLRVQTHSEGWMYGNENEWVKEGNTLIILGVPKPVTEAPFYTEQESSVGSVEIHTTQRAANERESLLGDRFGSIVWQENVGDGRIIYATTPFIAANAYQDSPGNYEFLAQLVTKFGENIVVDEYIHGYRDKEQIEAEVGESISNYLAKTPLLTIFIQIIVIMLVIIWAGNRRFGQPISLSAPKVNNSKAYIEALAGVLQKAGSRDFLVDVISKEEQEQLQKALGLGTRRVDPQTLIQTWQQTTGKSSTELRQVLQMQQQKRYLKDTELLIWLKKWEIIRNSLSKTSNS
ncbi:MAG: DUF4350 domain-containing protein [Chroococcales cyanobacterium]